MEHVPNLRYHADEKDIFDWVLSPSEWQIYWNIWVVIPIPWNISQHVNQTASLCHLERNHQGYMWVVLHWYMEKIWCLASWHISRGKIDLVGKKPIQGGPTLDLIVAELALAPKKRNKLPSISMSSGFTNARMPQKTTWTQLIEVFLYKYPCYDMLEQSPSNLHFFDASIMSDSSLNRIRWPLDCLE